MVILRGGSLPTEIPVIVTTSLDQPNEIVSVETRVEVADESVATLELDSTTVTVAMAELEAIVVVDVPVEMLELEVTVVVDVPLVVPRGGGLEPGIAGGAIGNVVFRAGHPEDPASRRTGQ